MFVYFLYLSVSFWETGVQIHYPATFLKQNFWSNQTYVPEEMGDPGEPSDLEIWGEGTDPR